MKGKSKKGISLIVLVITIIVIIILSVSVILSIANNNPIDNAKKATDAWNKREELESLNLCLTQYFAEGNNTSLADYIKSNFEFQERVEEVGSSIVVIAKNYAYVVDKESKKILVQSEKEVIEEILAVKKEYEAVKDTLLENKKTTLREPYAYESKYPENDTALVEVLPSYNKDKYRLSLQRGNLVCLYDLGVMTEEKIKVCEAFDIYLLGDVNGDHKLYFDDRDLLLKIIAKDRTKRQKIVMDVLADDAININDGSSLMMKLSSLYYAELKLIQNEVVEKRKEKLSEGLVITDINAITTEEVREYAPTYNESLGYRIIVRNGFPFFVYDRYLEPLFVYNSGVKLIGDITADGKLDQDDIEALEYYVVDAPSEIESIRPNILPIYDVNYDKTVDSQDLELLRELVNN